MSSKQPTKKRSTNRSTRKDPSLPLNGEVGGNTDQYKDQCDLEIDVDLEGVRAEGLSGLAVGDELDVRLEPVGAFKSAVCVRKDGQVVGALSSFLNLSQLLSCLEKGIKYAVTVTHIGAGSCHVTGERIES